MSRTGRHWVLACALAETVGMAAAAAAARGAGALDAPAAALGVLAAGGLVEGTALGVGQSAVLSTRLPRLRRGTYTTATVLVAGLGWAAASAPSVLAGDGSGTAPPLPLVLLGAAGIGLGMGALLGGAQALALRRAARAPWRWVLANTLAWPPAMVVIFLGATTPDESWSTAAVVLLGAATGAVAGSVLGVVTTRFLPLPEE